MVEQESNSSHWRRLPRFGELTRHDGVKSRRDEPLRMVRKRGFHPTLGRGRVAGGAEAVLRALKGAIPRGMPDHRTAAGRAYTGHLRALASEYPGLPESARPLLRTAGRLVVEILQDEEDRDRARAARRLSEMRRIDRRLNFKRRELRATEERLEHLASTVTPSSFASVFGEPR